MKKFYIVIIVFMLAACGDDSSHSGTGNSTTPAADAGSEALVPLGASDATYEWEQREVVYAQGQTHANWNDDEPRVVDLEATIWDPLDTPGTRPALLIIHGGGFLGGTRMQPELVEIAEHYAARGWLVMSMSYRMLGDRPTHPQAWAEGVESSGLADILQQIGRTIYGSVRDGKAAVRYLQANASELRIDPQSIAVTGGSAGAIIAVAIGVTEPGDFRDELLESDPTLESTNLEQDGRVAAVINHWGSAIAVEGYDLAYDIERWDSSDAPLMIVHGTADTTVEYAEAEVLRDLYESTGAPYEFYAIEGAVHGPWDAQIEGRSLIEVGFQFAVTHQGVQLD
jgi:acetyl esterase/lipase